MSEHAMLPYLIVGQGLAGTALAWCLHERGMPFLIVDRHEAQTSSKVAAGLVTPVTGMRLNLSWRYGELYPEAMAFYQKRERELGERFYFAKPIVRLFRDEKARELWSKRIADPEVQRYVVAKGADEPLLNEAVFANPFGGFEQQHSGWLDAAAFVEASRRFFESLGAWQQGEVHSPELEVKPDEVVWKGRRFAGAVFCTGWEAALHPWFDWVPFKSARGTVLKVAADTAGEERIINRGCWVLPHRDGQLRVGPTYEVPFSATEPHQPAPGAVAGLEAKLQKLLLRPYEVLGMQTGVRPIIRDRQALMGRHPARPRIAFLNGLGSKGVLRAPWLARMLTEHLLDGREIEPELDLASNLD